MFGTNSVVERRGALVNAVNMDESDQKALECFPLWLQSLGADVGGLASVLCDGAVAEEPRLWVAGAVSYIFKSVDLIPDGIEDLGYLDDAFILRVMARRALDAQDSDAQDIPAVLQQLAADTSTIEQFLGSDFVRLDEFAAGLRIASVRGRTPSDIVQDASVAAEVAQEAGVFARSYVAPEFEKHERTLIKLKSFLSTKLP